jgi:hypothetical protein
MKKKISTSIFLSLRKRERERERERKSLLPLAIVIEEFVYDDEDEAFD